MAEDKTSTSETSEPEELDPLVRWVIPQRLDNMTFIGKDILAVAHDIYIIFLNLKTGTELVYVANSETNGDGVDVIAGHRSSMFAFAEKVKHARIFILSYPQFGILAELQDMDVNRYKGLCLMEGDMVVGFSGFPDYLISVWSWRTGQRLLSLPTGVVRRRQLYMASRSHMLVCECWGPGLIVWEVAPCFKRCLMMKRVLREPTAWELPAPPLVAICWTSEGNLCACDPAANLYSVTSDGIGMVSNLEWSDNLKGDNEPCMCSFGNGILIYGPDDHLRFLKKAELKWKVAWQCRMSDVVEKLVSNAAADSAAAWCRTGYVYRLVPGNEEDNLELKLFAYKQRHIMKAQLVAPDFDHVVTMNDSGVLCIYEALTAKLVHVKQTGGSDVQFEASPARALVALTGAAAASGTGNYGLALVATEGLRVTARACLTHQRVNRVAFAPTGLQLLAAAMDAGHIFIYHISEKNSLTLVRYAELGRGLADCFLMKVGEFMRAFCLVLFSDKYAIGERIISINAETGKDNKFAGKMQGPYGSLVPLSCKDTALAVPHLSRYYHVLKLSGEKGVTVSVKMGPVIDSGHALRQFGARRCEGALLTFGADGCVVVRRPDGPPEYDWKLVASHRYETGLRSVSAHAQMRLLVTLACSGTLALTYRCAGFPELRDELRHEPPPAEFHLAKDQLTIVREDDKNYLDQQEDKKVHEEAMDNRRARNEVLRTFEALRARLVDLLEENIRERPLHQLSLAEFNLHMEHKKERLKQAEKDREEVKLQTEARIRAQDKVTAWIKARCWDTMLSPRVKLFAIFSHYHVENYAVLPTQREVWPELQQTMALRGVEMELDQDLFRPWEEAPPAAEPALALTPSRIEKEAESDEGDGGGGGGEEMDARTATGSLAQMEQAEPEEVAEGEPYVLAGSSAHRYVPVPPEHVPQTLAFSFLQMNWLHHLVKLNVQNMRLWFNKQFDELMVVKRREVGLVAERNARLRFILEELNKLSDLRGSFHHLLIQIFDPEWRQEEKPILLIKVDPEECTIPPYISPSQIVVPPPEPKPKDDFKERALNDMMDGVLEKLWHEEIKKPIPMPQCMLDKEPEHFNEEDLKLVFDYEAKVAFRNEERNKYRRMLHAEYAKLSQLLNEGIVKFNMRVKDTWLMKLKVDSVIGQENLNLMRLRRVNLDRVEEAERLEDMRGMAVAAAASLEVLVREAAAAAAASAECQATYDALARRDRHMDRTFKNNFADLSPIVVEQCYKFFKKRPKWHQRATMIPTVLNELASGVLAGVRPPLLHPDCYDYFKAVDQLDQLTNMPPVMDEGLWVNMCRLRRAKIENEIRMRSVVQETAYVDSAVNIWGRGVAARRAFLASSGARQLHHRLHVELTAVNKTVQLVLPAGQVEIVTTGHVEDFEDAVLLPREDVDTINNLILRVGAMKLRLMRRQIEFRKVILAKEWEHAQMKMKLRHLHQELYSYQRLKIPKELQWFLKNKELGYTDEQDYVRLEKEMAANKMSINRVLTEQLHRSEELQLKISALEAASLRLEKLLVQLNLKVSEKRLNEDPLDPIRKRRVFKKRMETLVARGRLIRAVQAQHSHVVLLQTELELLRLRTYPTLATFRTFC